MKAKIKQILDWQSLLDIVKKHQLWILIILGLLVGLYFVFNVPPWMHYDEPGHFEYAWLIANKPGLPEESDYDQNMRRQISASIIETDIEAYTGMTTDPLRIDQPISIWITHIGNHPPTYYILTSLLLRLFRHSDIVFQLCLVRLVSSSLFLGLIWVSFRTSKTLFGEDHPLVWMIPLFFVTLPSFVDIMTAANNDVLAILAFSLFIWASVEIIKKGITLPRLGALAGTVILCLIAKNTAWLAAPLSLVVMLLAFFNGKKYEKVIWISLIGLALLGIGVIFSWRENAPAFFYSQVPSARPAGVRAENWEIGERVIAQKSQSHSWKRFFHLLPSQDTAQLATKTVTLGAWIWADAPTSISPPGIQQGLIIEPLLTSEPVATLPRIPIPSIRERSLGSPIDIKFSTDTIDLTVAPQFFAFKTVIPPMGENITWVYFSPSTDEGNRVYWDGIVLVEGDFTDAGSPTFSDADASGGMWGGVPFTNIIRNASGENQWPVFAGWVSDLLPQRTFLSTSDILSIFDFEATGIYFQYTAERLFRTFWAVFGWANVPMLGGKPYRFFFLLTFIYLMGVVVGLVRKSFGLSWNLLLLMGLAVALQGTIVLLRGVGSWFSQTYIPVARYFYPAILPIGVILAYGMHILIRALHNWMHVSKKILYGAYVLMQLGIILWAMVSIRIFYHL